MSVIELGQGFDRYQASLRTARKRAHRCEELGYEFAAIERCEWENDIYEINVSKAERQGRPMNDGYRTRPQFAASQQPCERHRVNAYGVLDRNATLRAYAFVYRAGELALVSQILGHAEHLENHVMHLLVVETVRREMQQGGCLVYNRHDSGTEGLVQFKEWLRFQAMEVEWKP